MVARTDTATVVGGVCVFASVSLCERACMRAYDHDILPLLKMIIIKICILYFIQIRHTDVFAPSCVSLLFVRLLPLIQFAFTLTVHINALYNVMKVYMEEKNMQLEFIRFR